MVAGFRRAPAVIAERLRCAVPGPYTGRRRLERLAYTDDGEQRTPLPVARGRAVVRDAPANGGH